MRKYYVYVLVNLKNGDLYIGSTSDFQKRITMHNTGKVKSTKGYVPWKLLELQYFLSRSDAVKKERFLKNHQQKEILKEKYGLVPKR